MAALTLLEVWPVLGLRVRTPRLELRPVDTDLALALGNLAADGVHDADLMPFLAPWTDASPPQLQENTVRWVWDTWSRFTPQHWSLPFAVTLIDGDDRVLVGNQSIHEAVHFPQLR